MKSFQIEGDNTENEFQAKVKTDRECRSSVVHQTRGLIARQVCSTQHVIKTKPAIVVREELTLVAVKQTTIKQVYLFMKLLFSTLFYFEFDLFSFMVDTITTLKLFLIGISFPCILRCSLQWHKNGKFFRVFPAACGRNCTATVLSE